jgi:hypothetical protein
LELKDLFAGGKSSAANRRKYLNAETARLFAEAEEKINVELNRLDQQFIGSRTDAGG